MASALPSETTSLQAQSSSQARAAPGVLVLDAHTFRDLEIFESAPGGTCLFRFCDLTRSPGGAQALRRRMERPWSDAVRIRATQASLSFIAAQRQAFDFDGLPSLGYATSRVEHYTRETLSIVTHGNAFEFGLGVLDLWINRDRDYNGILRGVHLTVRLIRALRRFVARAELASPAGELAGVLEEMRALLARPKLSGISGRDAEARGPWRVLRLDQTFRLHEKAAIDRLLRLVYETDALVALADVMRKHGFVLPRIDEGEFRVHAEGLVHPLVRNAVANPVALDQKRRVLFLTGPNMAGKTTYLRAFATTLYLAHLGMGVPARSFAFVPAQRLFSWTSLNDDLHAGLSYFRAEALRMKAIAEAVADGHRVLALMDEPFKGTNVKDAYDASLAILERFASSEDCLFVFSSHLIELRERLRAYGRVDCCCFEADESDGRLRFGYLLRPGVSSQRLGMRVLREEGVFELLDRGPVAD